MTGESGTTPHDYGVIGFYKSCPKCSDYVNWRTEYLGRDEAPYHFEELAKFHGFCTNCRRRLIVTYVGQPGKSKKYRSTSDYRITFGAPVTNIGKAG